MMRKIFYWVKYLISQIFDFEGIFLFIKVKNKTLYLYRLVIQFPILFRDKFYFIIYKNQTKIIQNNIRSKIINRKLLIDLETPVRDAISNIAIYSEIKDTFDLKFIHHILSTYLELSANIITIKSNLKDYKNIILIGDNQEIVNKFCKMNKLFIIFPINNGIKDKSLYAQINGIHDHLIRLRVLAGLSFKNLIKYNNYGNFNNSKNPVYSKLDLETSEILYFNFDVIAELLTSNLWHQFNIQGSIPEVFSNCIRLLQYTFSDYGLYTKKNPNLSTLISIDTEAELNYFDFLFNRSTNLLSDSDLQCMKTSNTIKNISERAPFSIILFFAFAQIFKNEKDLFYNSRYTYMDNIKQLKKVQNRLEIGYHQVHHEEYRERFFKQKLTKEFLLNDFHNAKNVCNKNGIKLLPINRYPTLYRNPSQLHILEQQGFKFDSSDHINEPNNCISPLKYQLWKYYGKNKIKLTNIWEIPCIWSDIYLITKNHKKAVEFLILLEKWSNYNSFISLMFHDKIVGCNSTNSEILFNIYNITRTIKSATKEEISHFWNLLQNKVKCVKISELMK